MKGTLVTRLQWRSVGRSTKRSRTLGPSKDSNVIRPTGSLWSRGVPSSSTSPLGLVEPESVCQLERGFSVGRQLAERRLPEETKSATPKWTANPMHAAGQISQKESRKQYCASCFDGDGRFVMTWRSCSSKVSASTFLNTSVGELIKPVNVLWKKT